VYGAYYGPLHIATQYQWCDGHSFFDTSTSHLRKLQAPEQVVMHKSLQKWKRYVDSKPDLRRLWQQTWVSWRSAKENAFLWQMLYWVPATQHWRFPQLSRLDDSTHCTRYRRNQVEDILHCMWSCPRSGRVWSWIIKLLEVASKAGEKPIVLQFHHVLLAEKLEDQYRVPEKLWQTLQASVSWVLWKARCKHVMENEHTTAKGDIRRTWY
jgi:hypothetical protein